MLMKVAVLGGCDVDLINMSVSVWGGMGGLLGGWVWVCVCEYVGVGV